jgi:hypothetical protein
MMLYTLIKTFVMQHACECEYCGTFDSIDKALAHRDGLIREALFASLPERLSTGHFQLIRTRCNETVSLSIRHLPPEYDVDGQKKRLERAAGEARAEADCSSMRNDRDRVNRSLFFP